MSMDALTTAAINSLIGDLLPKLTHQLKGLSTAPLNAATPDEKLLFALSETREMLQLVEKWAQRGLDASLAPPQAATNQEQARETGEMSDAEAKKLLAQMDGIDAPAAPAASAESEISDEEARKLLAQMDGLDVQSPVEKTDNEMSDAEAKKLLAQMDGMDSPAATSVGTISDEEARKLLAQMDGLDSPLQAAKAEEIAPEVLSDDDATMVMAHLGEVEEPIAQSAPKTTPPAKAPQAVAAKKVAAPSASPPSPDAELFECTEIDEWEKNDFQTDPDMVNDFIGGSDDLMQTLDDQILALEQDPGSKEIIESIFRAAHTLKGAGGMFGFRAIERVMHRMESLFDKIRKGQMAPNSDIIDLVFKGLDTLRVLLAAVKDKKPCGIKTGEIVKLLTMAAAGKAVSVGRQASPSAADPVVENKETHEPADLNAAKPEGKTNDQKPDAATAKQQKDPSASTIRVDLDRLDALVNLIGELVIDRTKFVSIEEELRTHHPNVKISGNIAETVQLFGRHMNEIQDIIMKVRMVPIGNTFAKYPRIVRDLSKSLDKKINLHLSGESAEMDKTLVESIGDPLVHLIRNSCDHGVESPADRIKAGKDPTGNIYLSARQEGNSIAIEIRDDGKGINPDIIKRKAIEKGLISPEAKLTRRDILNLIFEPGFSTAEKVTNVSGRGVGMDVVKKAIMKLKGMLDIESEVGKGTTLTIQLPLTLAIVQSLLVNIKDEIFAIPLSSVIESIRITDSEIQRVGDAQIIKLRNKVLPLLHLDEVLNLDAKQHTMSAMIAQRKKTLTTGRKSHPEPNHKKHFVVVVGQQDRPFGIVVDYLLNQQEMVIKSMGAIMSDIPAVAGGSVLGNGEVVLVLDILKLQDTINSKNRGVAA